MFKSIRTAAVLFLAVAPVLFVFQNCAPPGQIDGVGSKASSSSTPTQTCTADCGVDITDPSMKFDAGDAYATKLIPFALQGSIKTAATSYPSLTGFKSIAFAANGKGAVANDADYKSQAEASRIAMEVCQVASGNQTCSVFAEGNFIKDNEVNFALKRAKRLEEGPRTFKADKVPFVCDAIRSTQMTTYETSTVDKKAVVVAASGASAYVLDGDTVDDSQKIAMERCEALNNGEPCTPYAVGNRVLFNETALTVYTVPRIDYSRKTFDASKVPFVNPATRKNLKDDYKSVNGSSIALAINGEGVAVMKSYVKSSSIKDPLAKAKTDALSACNSKKKVLSCFIYAEGTAVKMTVGDIQK